VNSEPPEALSFAERLRLLRARLGLSQEQLARRLSVSFATVNRWEAGRSRPSARAAAAIAELEASASRGHRQEPADEQTPRLPIAQSSFVGRERERAAISELLTRSRLINLTGPGGVGKTRLGIEVARRWAASGGEVVFVPLAAAMSCDAVALFADRARAQGAGLLVDEQTAPLVVSVCRRLDGLPLAIELAAARLRSMSLPDLHGRLGQRFRLLTGGSRTALERRRCAGPAASTCWRWPACSGRWWTRACRGRARRGRAAVPAAGDDPAVRRRAAGRGRRRR
jgi:transcriptional regulator with XRE-family HTH domain